jgi:hypothetical protein
MVIATIAFAVVWPLSTQLRFTLVHLDTWFDTDSRHVIDAVTNRLSIYHGRNNLHPLFGLITYPPGYALRRYLHVGGEQLAVIMVSAMAALWSSTMYFLYRLALVRRSAAIVAVVMTCISTAGMFFVPILERYVLGSISIMVCLAVFIAYRNWRISSGWLTLAAAATLGFTITNFMVGVVTLVVALGPRKGLQSAINAFVVILSLSLVQARLFPSSPPFLTWDNAEKSVGMSQAGSITDRSSAFWFYSVVMPNPVVETKPPPSLDRYLSVERVGSNASGLSSDVASWLWILLLALGCLVLATDANARDLGFVLGVSIIGQFALCMEFGTEVILYSLHFVPMLMLVAGHGLLGRAAKVAWPAAIVLLFILFWHNWQVFNSSRSAAISIIGAMASTASGK